MTDVGGKRGGGKGDLKVHIKMTSYVKRWLWSNHSSPPLSCCSPRIDDGADSSTSHLATVNHPPRARLPVCLPDRRRDLADLIVRDRVEGCVLTVPPPPDIFFLYLSHELYVEDEVTQ